MENTLKIKRRRPASLEKRKARAGYVFVLPFILGIVLVYLPILIDSIWFSFFERRADSAAGAGSFVYVFQGFEYYRYAFTGSPDFMAKLLSGKTLESPSFIFHFRKLSLFR